MEITYLVTSIMTALGTVGAVVAAVVLGLGEQKRGNAERERIAVESARVQASHVMAWDVTSPLHDVYPDGSNGRIVGWQRTVSIQNRSSGPIFDVRVRDETGRVLVTGLALLPSAQPNDWKLSDAKEEASTTLARLEFRDMAGVTWMRDERGHLVRG